VYGAPSLPLSAIGPESVVASGAMPSVLASGGTEASGVEASVPASVTPASGVPRVQVEFTHS
jgi:hypothetical protein